MLPGCLAPTAPVCTPLLNRGHHTLLHSAIKHRQPRQLLGSDLVVRSQSEAMPTTIQREVLTNRERLKLDTADDSTFYDLPRIVQHVDDTFRRKVSQLYRQTIPANGTVLDLMSSWVSHLPQDVPYSLVVGHGMNAQELKRNKQLDRFFIRDLNKDPNNWSEKDNTFDAVVCCVSVQYMQQPERVFAEIHRVLKPGGFTEAKVVTEVELPAESLTGFASIQAKISKLLGVATQQDPFYAVLAYKQQS